MNFIILNKQIASSQERISLDNEIKWKFIKFMKLLPVNKNIPF